MCAVKYENYIPEKINLRKKLRICESKLHKAGILITLPKTNESGKNEYSIIIIYKKVNFVFRLLKKVIYQKKERTYFTEIIRQPSLFVKKTSKENRPQGYYIFGRSNENSVIHSSFKIQIVKNKQDQIPNIFKQRLEIIKSNNLTGKVPNILILSAKICCVLQQMKRQIGINNMSYQKYIDLPFEKKIAQNLVVPGSFSCQWLRDLFLDAISFFEGIQTRALDAFAQSECSEPLVRCSHAVAEVFCQNAQKWFLIDPWNNYLVKNKKGVFLNGENLQNSIVTGKLIGRAHV